MSGHRQETAAVNPDRPKIFSVRLRIPKWSTSESFATGDGLYTYVDGRQDMTVSTESVFDTDRISGGTLGGIVSLVSRDCVDDRISLIPYYSWDNRSDKTSMRVWLKEK